MEGYFGALQTSQMAQELLNQKLELLQQKKESTLPLSEMLTAEGGKSLLEQGFNTIKENAMNAAKEFARSKMKEVGIDDDTISGLLKGDFTDAIKSKVSNLIDTAKSTGEEAISQVKGTVEGAIDEATGTVEGLANQLKGTVEDAQGMISDSLDNITSTVRQNIATAQGIADDLKAQAIQEYNASGNMGEISLSDVDTNTSNLFQRFMNYAAPEPQDIEMVDMAAPETSDITTGISDILSSGQEALSGLTSGVSEAISGATEAVSGVSEAASVAGGALEGLAVGADFLGPVGALAGLALGIFGISEAEKSQEIQQPILNPSTQFL